ncbi:MAG: NAD(P)H-dependent glycerol-3-phosphate dehydrogenase [Firmicutes bacterium]|nr:NAD(P)H-dependent glycerol-3-phosphate dehydrogenase [Bacillota bacterium]
MDITVVGAGGWGTALACLLVSNGHKVTLWSWQQHDTDNMLKERENRAFLPGVSLPAKLEITSDLKAVSGKELVLFAVPSAVMSGVAEQAAPIISRTAIVVNAAKGLVPVSLRRMSEVLQDLLPHNHICVLSGPSHAEEVARQLPAAVCVAGCDKAACKTAQDVFMNSRFRVYTSPDLIGVEIGGAIKNIVALASGVCDGLGLGDNTRAALMTRGLAEMKRLGLAMGAQADTFAGLTGMGDLIVTCTSQHSRNYRTGREIGRGRKWREVLAETEMVVEGVYATDCAYALSHRLGVEMPITDQMYRVLYEDQDPRTAMWELMTRRRTEEAD